MAVTPDDTLQNYSDVIRKCPVLQGFTDEELRAFLGLVRYDAFKGGESILTEGNHFKALWFVLEGRCEVVKKGQSKDSQLAILEPGNVFGEMSFLHTAAHSATVRSCDPVKTMRLSMEDYQHLHANCHTAADKIAYNIIRLLSDRLREMDRWTCQLVEQDCSQKRHQEWHEFRARLYTDLFD